MVPRQLHREFFMQNEVKPTVSDNLDKVGIVCSGACAVHCLLLPIIALFSPAIASFFESEWIHKGLLIFLTPVAILAFVRGFNQHHKSWPMISGVLGIVLLLAAVAAEELLEVEIENLETILTVMGCLFLITAHIFNIKFLRSSKVSWRKNER